MRFGRFGMEENVRLGRFGIEKRNVRLGRFGIEESVRLGRFGMEKEMFVLADSEWRKKYASWQIRSGGKCSSWQIRN